MGPPSATGEGALAREEEDAAIAVGHHALDQLEIAGRRRGQEFRVDPDAGRPRAGDDDRAADLREVERLPPLDSLFTARECEQ